MSVCPFFICISRDKKKKVEMVVRGSQRRSFFSGFLFSFIFYYCDGERKCSCIIFPYTFYLFNSLIFTYINLMGRWQCLCVSFSYIFYLFTYFT